MSKITWGLTPNAINGLLSYNIVLLRTLFEGLCSKQRVFKLVVACAKH